MADPPADTENTSMTSRVETALRAAIVGAFCVPAIGSFLQAEAQGAPYVADPARPADRAILDANGDAVAGSKMRNVCGGIVRPRIALVGPDIAIVTEVDPTGQCVGSNPPGMLTVLLRTGGIWHGEAGFPATGFRLGLVHAGRPDIIAEYPPFDRDCPVLSWNGQHYLFARGCPDGKSQ
jgi:hypothetical protein